MTDLINDRNYFMSYTKGIRFKISGTVSVVWIPTKWLCDKCTFYEIYPVNTETGTRDQLGDSWLFKVFRQWLILFPRNKI